MNQFQKKAWIVSADMGYGHYRASLPLLDIAQEGKIILANNYPGIPQGDKRIWEQQEKFYNTISRFNSFPVIGKIAFRIFDQFQKVSEFNPDQKETAPTLQLRYLYSFIKRGWGRHFIEMLSKNPLPLFCTFFAIAHMADYWEYPSPVYLLLTDSDVSRAWVSLNPQKSKIIYLTPTKRATDRLLTYGVPSSRIIHTGFPLPQELQGENNEIAKNDLKRRLSVLDPFGRYRKENGSRIEKYLGAFPQTNHTNPEPVCLMFSLGGAGAQQKIGEEIIKSVFPLIPKNELHIILALGTRPDVHSAFHTLIKNIGLNSFLNTRIFILFDQSKEKYFTIFNQALRRTDILWTKPSELSFYAGLGIPLILTPPLGSHEVKNKEWLLEIHAATKQEDPEKTHEWLPKLIESGRLAENALNGFIHIRRDGKETIERILLGDSESTA